MMVKVLLCNLLSETILSNGARTTTLLDRHVTKVILLVRADDDTSGRVQSEVNDNTSGRVPPEVSNGTTTPVVEVNPGSATVDCGGPTET